MLLRFIFSTLSAFCFAFIPVEAQTSGFSTCNNCIFGLPGPVSQGAFGDYDNDGDLDVLVGGLGNYTGGSNNGSQSSFTSLYRNNGTGTFTLNTANSFTGLTNGAIAWVDYNRDGFLDIAIMGEYVYVASLNTTRVAHLQIYRNQGNGTFAAPIELSPLQYGGMDWADYDNDGDPDLLVTGVSGNYTSSTVSTLLYRNDGNNTFTSVTTSLPILNYGNAKWGDYDNDGDPDVLICGQTTQVANGMQGDESVTAIYKNNGNGTFTNINAGLTGVTAGYAAWKDFDNDGYLDLALQGHSANGLVFQVNRNQHDGTFLAINVSPTQNYPGNLVWSDFNGDGKADIASMGQNGGGVYLQTGVNQFTLTQSLDGVFLEAGDCNGDHKPDLIGAGRSYPLMFNQSTAATLPATPGGMMAYKLGNDVLFTWDNPTGWGGNLDGTTFNVRTGTSTGGIDIVSPMSATATGSRQVVNDGNAGHNHKLYLKGLASGTYHWAVQAQNPASQAGSFSSEGTVTLPGSDVVAYIDNQGNDTICSGGTTTLKAYTYPAATTFQWYRNNSVISYAREQEYTVTQSGQYKVVATTSRGVVTSNILEINALPDLPAPQTNNATACLGQSVTLTATPASGANTCTWYDNMGHYVSSGTSYTPAPPPAATTYYRVYSYASAGGCTGTTSGIANVTINPVPAAPTAQGQSACQPQAFELSATPGLNGNICRWYDHTSSSSVLAQSNTYNTGMVQQTKSWHVSTYNTATACESAARTSVTVTIDPVTAAPVTTDALLCVPGPATLHARPGAHATTCYWYTSMDGGTPVYTDTVVTLPNASATQTFFVSSANPAGHCESTARSPVTVTVSPVIGAPSTWDQQRYGASTVTLEAWPGNGATTCHWYSSASKTTLLGTGRTYTTPVLRSTTTYYVSSYDEAHGCEGVDAVAVQAQILPTPSVTVHPDQTYPIPNLYSGDNYKNVNLFTGDVNLTFNLMEVSGPILGYSLNAFYNSRGAGVTPLFTQNALGGLGWKLMDYPKIAYNAVDTTYYLLDGYQTYPLKKLSQTSTSVQYAASGSYHLWSITMGSLQQQTGSRTWQLVSEKGTQYRFTTPAIDHLDNNQPGYLWNLNLIRETQGRDSIQFTYTNGSLQQIQTTDLNTWNFTYDGSGRISALENVIVSTSVGMQYPQTQMQFAYGASFPGTSYTQLSTVTYLQNVAPPPYTTAQYQQAAPSVYFRYNNTNYPGALESMQAPQGGAVEYRYTLLPVQFRQYQIVTGVNTFSGTTFNLNNQTQQQYSPISLKYAGARASSDHKYLHFNECEIVPGGNQMYEFIGDQSTSFENPASEPVFRDLDRDYVSSDYALSGSKSYLFDGLVEDNTIHSRVFPLNKKAFHSYENTSAGTPVAMTGSEDSVRVAFYLFQTHDRLDVEFLWTITFYDSRGKAINNGSAGGSREIDSDNYGNWVPVEIVQAVPANAVSFDFKIVGGRSLNHYDFYMDDVSVSGSHNTLNGRIIYHYFNGGSLTDLVHVPDDYYTLYPDEQVRGVYKTGFEPGENYADWLNLDHSSSCKPTPTVSDDSRQVAYNGSGALGLSACDGHYSRVSPDSDLNIPSSTNQVLLSFNYSSAQFSGLQFSVSANVGSVNWDTTITVNGSYYTDQHYLRFNKWFNVASTHDDFDFTIEVLNAGGGKNINEFFIDDLKVVFLDKNVGATLPATQVTNTMYLGLSYHGASFTQANQELESIESFLIAGADAHAGNMPLPFLYRNYSIKQGVAREFKTYNRKSDGRVVSEHTTRDLENTDGTYQEVLYLDTYIYADSIYPALGRTGLHMLDEVTATVSSYSTGVSDDWVTYTAILNAWTSMTPTGSSNLGALWLNTASYVPKVQMSTSTIYSAVRHLNRQTPDAASWLKTNEIMAIDAYGRTYQTRSADSLISWQQYSMPEIEDAWHKKWNRAPVVTATFSDATPANSVYYGFEPYETPPPSLHATASAVYAFSGETSSQGTTYFTIPFNQGETPGNTYSISFQYLATTGSIRLTVTGSTTIVSQTMTPPTGTASYWQSAQRTFTVPPGITQIKIQLEGATTSSVYFDDIRLLPATSTFSGSVYDMEDYQLKSILNDNGVDMRFLYNWKGEQYATIGPGKVPLSFQADFMSAMNPSAPGQYNPLIPNSSFSIETRDGGHYFAFNDEADQNGWTMTNASYAQFSLNGMYMNNTNTARMPSLWNPTDWSNFGVSYQFLPVFSGNSTLENGFSVGNYKFTTRIARSNGQDQVTLSLYNGSTQTTLSTLTYTTQLSNPAYQVMVLFQQNHVHIWFNGQYIPNTFNYTGSTSSNLSLFYTRVSGSNSLSFNNLCILNAPEISGKFMDGLNNIIQEVQVNGNDLIVQETQYDLMFRPVLQTKKVLLTGKWPVFQTGFISSFDWSTGKMLGDVQQAKNYVSNGDDDQKYMYWRCVWNTSPNTQLKMLFKPGADFALRKQSDVEKAERWAYTHEEQIFSAIKYSLDLAQIIVDPEAAPFIIGMDVLGLVRKHFRKSTDNVQKEQAITSKFYNPLQQQIQIKLPLANTPKHTKPEHILTYGYDFNGNMTVRTAPESDTTKMVYDIMGRLRFSRTAEMGNSITYYKYDRWGRAIEKGIFSGIWNQTTLQQHAADPSYPNTGTTVQSKYYYDGSEGTHVYLAPYRGQLTRTESYESNTVANSVTFTYDLNGNLIQTAQLISGTVSPGTYTTQYQYDVSGNIKLIQYPVWNNSPFKVSYTYDYVGNMSNIGDQTTANAYASYEWNPDGSLYHEKLMQTNQHVLPVWHWYNAPGWKNYSGYGDTLRLPGLHWTWWGGLWPKVNYSFSMFSEQQDYNFLTDWWSDLWGQTYYNGNVASSTYVPATGNPASSLEQGYLYNDYGNLESYYSSYANESFLSSVVGDIVDAYLRDTLVYDLNGNLALRNFGKQLEFLSFKDEQYAGACYQYKISDSHNRPNYMAYSEYSTYSYFNYFLYDTLFVQYNKNGNVNLQQWKHRNISVLKGHPGSVAYQYWKRYDWNLFGQLSSLSKRDTENDSTYVSFHYDNLGMRLQKQVKWYYGSALQKSQNTTYLRNTNGDPMMEIITGGTRDTVKYYIWGPNGIEVMTLNDRYTTNSWFVLKDRLGSAKQLVNRATRAVDEYYATDEYGLLNMDDSKFSGLFNYIYTGQEYDRESRLHYFRARMYDPFSKMFLSPDPAGSNPATPYAYVENDPVNSTDPTGKIPFDAVFDATIKEERIAKTEFEKTTTKALMNMLPTTAEGAVKAENRKAMVEFRRRFNDLSCRRAEFDELLWSNHQKMKSILRPGGKHEMMPVASWYDLRELGIKLDDIQIFSHPTGETIFQVVDPLNDICDWGDEVVHGRSIHYNNKSDFGIGLQEMGYNEQYKTIGSGKAHNEIFDRVRYARENNYSRSQFLDLMEVWMRGDTDYIEIFDHSFTRVHEDHLDPWLKKLNTIRTRHY
ncbi:MAG TPA: FG-GAP-like repeat-containing protein [Saprospiraceae bacterium]|nr:FG-GAP-like repeat-containing protein [Saprospiraceae bacterium]